MVKMQEADFCKSKYLPGELWFRCVTAAGVCENLALHFD